MGEEVMGAYTLIRLSPFRSRQGLLSYCAPHPMVEERPARFPGAFSLSAASQVLVGVALALIGIGPALAAERADASNRPEQLAQLCPGMVKAGNTASLRQVQTSLLTMSPVPRDLAVVLAHAEALLICQAPQSALRVLDRYGPAAGAEREAWLLLRWRAANAGLDHRIAAMALQDLAGTDFSALETLQLELKRDPEGGSITRPALDQLADHLESQGMLQAAAQVLLSSTTPGEIAARRLAQAAALLAELPISERMRLLDQALDQAAAAGAWTRVSELLDRQLALPESPETASFRARAAERRLRLSRRLDDAYGEWSLPSSTSGDRRQALETQLRSPRAPGGHAHRTTSLSQP